MAKQIDEKKTENNYYGTPFVINLDADCKPLAVDAGATHSLLLSEDGNVYAWGQNNRGQLGLSLQIKRTVHGMDKNAFMVVVDANTVLGGGFEDYQKGEL